MPSPISFLRTARHRAAAGVVVTGLVAVAACTRPAAHDAADSAATGPANTSPAASTTSDSAAHAQSPWTVTPTSMGVLRIGMTAPEVAAALHTTVKPVYHDTPGCAQVRVASLPGGTLLMFVSDTLMRVDVDSAGVRTAEGAGVGDTEAHVMQLYGTRGTLSPHKYTGPVGHYLTIATPGDSLHRLVFETDGTKITQYRAGRLPAVEYVEGCN